jgi:hypothetical protein
MQLRQHLHHIQVVNNPACEYCSKAPENIFHYLLHCPHFNSECYIYLGSRGTEYLRLNFLLFPSEALGPLFDFVKAMGRFTDLLQ